MKPIIVLVGRPNVGKSTLFNRLTRSEDAVALDQPGTTRDRQYGIARYFDATIVDTGGVISQTEGLNKAVGDQAWIAVEEADIVFFITDALVGLIPEDQHIAHRLRSLGSKVVILANKADSDKMVTNDFYQLGMGEVYPISAKSGKNVRSVMQQFVSSLEEPEKRDRGIKVSIIGRPNVGKSTLINILVGSERSIVANEAGTTRDSIYIPYTFHDQQYTLIDTAGVRRRKNINEAVEQISILKTMQALADSHVALVLFDATAGVTNQDLRLLNRVVCTGRGMMILINKWDIATSEQKEAIQSELDRRLNRTKFIKIFPISAKKNRGLKGLHKEIDAIYHSAYLEVGTGKLNSILHTLVEDNPPPYAGRGRTRLKLAHLGGNNPLTIIIHGNRLEKLPNHYISYLRSGFMRYLEITGIPIKITLKSGENPYGD